MKVEINKNSVKVIREKLDKKIYKESTFFYYLKKELQRLGYDVIRAIPDKDGQLFSAPFYIRARHFERIKPIENQPYIFDNYYAMRQVFEPYNKEGFIDLSLDGILETAKYK